PSIWTTLDFEAEQSDAKELAEVFAQVLDLPGWYVNFQSPAESFVVFPGKIFRYPRGDAAGRAAAQAHGRQLAIPDPQLDWTICRDWTRLTRLDPSDATGPSDAAGPV